MVLSILPAILIVFDFAGIRPRAQNAQKHEKQVLGDLKAEFGDRMAVKVSRATNKVNFVRLVSDAPGSLIYNAYNRALIAFPFSDNLRAGQPAFSGTDGLLLNNGSWGTSIVDLSGYAQGGDTVRLRFDMSTDFCLGTGTGWYLDNVRVYACRKTCGK